MSKILVIIYSFLILIQSFNINFEDISKFNALLKHITFHQENYGDNFIEFLSEHYGDKMASHENQHKQHEDLPFKDSHHILTHVNISFLLFSSILNPSINHQILEDVSINFSYKEPFSLHEKLSVFQPPKIA